MYIDEVAAGSHIVLTVYIGSDKMEFETTALSVDKKVLGKMGLKQRMLPVSPIQKDGKTVGFRQGLVYRVVATHENAPYLWTDLNIMLISLPGSNEKAHLIVTDQEAKKHNRRNAFRQWVGLNGIVQLSSNHKAVDVIVKDISSTGISFVLRKEEGTPAIGEFAHVVFADEAMGTRFSLVTTVVRCVDMDESRYLVGCQLKSTSTAVERYITEKQRNTMKTGGVAASMERRDKE